MPDCTQYTAYKKHKANSAAIPYLKCLFMYCTVYKCTAFIHSFEKRPCCHSFEWHASLFPAQYSKRKKITFSCCIHSSIERELRAERALWKMWTLSTLANKSNNNNSHLHWCKSFVGPLYHCYSLFSVVRLWRLRRNSTVRCTYYHSMIVALLVHY